MYTDALLEQFDFRGCTREDEEEMAKLNLDVRWRYAIEVLTITFTVKPTIN